MSENEKPIPDEQIVRWEKPLVKGKDAYIDGFGYINDPDNEDFKNKIKLKVDPTKSDKNLIEVKRDKSGFVIEIGLTQKYINESKTISKNLNGTATEAVKQALANEEKRKEKYEEEKLLKEKKEKEKEDGRVIIEKFIKEKKLESSVNLLKFTNSFSGDSKHRCVYQIVGDDSEKTIVGSANEIKDDILFNIQKNATINNVDLSDGVNSAHA